MKIEFDVWSRQGMNSSLVVARHKGAGAWQCRLERGQLSDWESMLRDGAVPYKAARRLDALWELGKNCPLTYSR